MANLEFSGDHAGFFTKHGLASFEDIFEYSSGKIINQNKKRNVTTFTLDDDGVEKRFFMKRFFSPHFKDMLFTFRNFGYICSQGRCEFNNASLLLENGIDTYRPVCYGQEMSFGIEKRSFFITEEIKGICLTDFITEKWSTLDQDEKQKIVAAIGKISRKIHDANMSMPDLYVWHFFIKNRASGSDDYEFAIIDLHRMSINVKNKDLQYKNLGALDYSMLDDYFDDELRDTLLRSYIGDDPPCDRQVLKSKLKARSEILAARRRRPKY